MTIDFAALPSAVWPLVVYCLGVYFIVLCIRYLCEARKPALTKSAAWKKVLRVMPPAFGGVAAAIMYKYPFLDTLPTWGTRFIYGCFAGGVSSFMYMVAEAVIQKWFGVKVKKAYGDPPVRR